MELQLESILLPGIEEKRPLVIAGPCSAETEEQVMDTAKQLSAKGMKIFRAGIWKPRTKPGGFEGIGAKAVSVSAALQPPPDIAAATVSSVSIPASSVSYIAKKSFMSSSMCALVFIYHIPYFPRCKWDFLDIGGKCGIIISFAISQRRFISGGQIRVLSPGNCERQRSSWKTKERKSSLRRCCS